MARMSDIRGRCGDYPRMSLIRAMGTVCFRDEYMKGQESVPSVLESDAKGEIADIYADIRNVLDTSVVNLIWRNLATMPGALEWTWSTVRPLYLGDAPLHAEAVRRTIALPDCPGFSTDTLLAAGLDEAERALICDVLDSYQYTNALALVVLSALLAHFEPRPAGTVTAADTAPKPSGAKIPELPPMDALDPEVAALVGELNSFGEDTEPQLIASMYRHLAYWPAYLALVRTMLAPLQRQGRLNALTLSTRALGYAHGAVLASQLKPATPPDTLKGALASCRLFVEHPIARMTGLCALIRRATPD
jgi:hypothetical protein